MTKKDEKLQEKVISKNEKNKNTKREVIFENEKDKKISDNTRKEITEFIRKIGGENFVFFIITIIILLIIWIIFYIYGWK